MPDAEKSPPKQPEIQQAPQRPPRDPYPRMIIVCIAISAVLFFVIAGFLAYDFIFRSMAQPPEEGFELFDAPGETPSPPPEEALDALPEEPGI